MYESHEFNGSVTVRKPLWQHNTVDPSKNSSCSCRTAVVVVGNHEELPLDVALHDYLDRLNELFRRFGTLGV